ncbi:unnamed protein product [Adineta ricciae]|uniref:Uncharacterized protein n=1 Tax=Adineta ricciae TaxID=249248 RepID=A0A814U6S7_ADIRI|nr:unnamed protein product [Adineta ricciae]CAF1172418.1 unnamed protein product [Adineta ricciae]
MKTQKLKSTVSADRLPRKSADYLFQPITSIDQRKSPSPFQTGLRYLKLLSQSKRHNGNSIKPFGLDRLERTSAFSTNYYAPLSSRLTNKSTQIDVLDEVSLKSTVTSYCSLLPSYEFIVTTASILLFILFIFHLQFNPYPVHCLLHKKFWYPIDFSTGFNCENTNVQIYYMEIHSKFYQLELQKNPHAMNCLGFHILSCLPIDYSSIPKGQIIRRNDQFTHYCNRTQKFICQNQSLHILPYESKWKLRNSETDTLPHCSCLERANQTRCFHFKIREQCDLQIPWIDVCVKYSATQSTCQAYVKKF